MVPDLLICIFKFNGLNLQITTYGPVKFGSSFRHFPGLQLSTRFQTKSPGKKLVSNIFASYLSFCVLADFYVLASHRMSGLQSFS